MKKLLIILFGMALLTACQQREPNGAHDETSPGGIAYTRLYIPDAKDVAVRVAWRSDWAYRADVNHAVPYVGADLILSGGAEGYPAGEVVETFADLKAEARLENIPGYTLGYVTAPKENIAQVSSIVAAHLAKPTLAQDWLQRIRDGFGTRIAEISAQPAAQSFIALRWAVLGDQPLRAATSLDAPGLIGSVTGEQVQAWHASTFKKAGAFVVIAGAVDAKTAGETIDTILGVLPEGTPEQHRPVTADFSARRILLHVPEAKTTTLTLVGLLPPTREGREFEDMIALMALGGDDKSVLFNAVRTELRAGYGFGAGQDAYDRDTRLFVMTGEVETAKLAEAEAVVKKAYSGFLAKPGTGDLQMRKAPLLEGINTNNGKVDNLSFGALLALIDGVDPAIALKMQSVLDEVTDETVSARVASAFPKPDALVTIAVSPDANSLPGACVITSPPQAAACK